MDPFVAVVRRWATAWLAAGDASACPQVLAPGYRVRTGGHVLDGRDAYVAATQRHLLERFPSVGITVHELLATGDRVALRFTLHGADQDGRAIAWGGVALFRWDGERLTECVVEEDLWGRRRQLASGTCDPVEPPAPAPWNTPVRVPDPGAEQAVRAWLERGGDEDDVRLDDAVTAVDELMSAGADVAFHAVRRGRYAGGLDGLDGARGAEAVLALGGIARVERGEVVRARAVHDRLGVHRALATAVTG